MTLYQHWEAALRCRGPHLATGEGVPFPNTQRSGCHAALTIVAAQIVAKVEARCARDEAERIDTVCR